MATTRERLEQVMATARRDFAERCRMGGGAPKTEGPIDRALRLLANGTQPELEPVRVVIDGLDDSIDD